MRVSSWLKFHVGMDVWDVADERHTGRIVRINFNGTADILWHETGWMSVEVPVTDLRRFDGAGRVIKQWS